MSSSSSSDADEASKARGPTLKMISHKGKIKVKYNKKGVPVGDGGTKLATCEGVVSRTMVKITFETWRHVPIDTKDAIWDYLNMNFLLDRKSKKQVLKSVGKKWRNFKHYLFKKFIEEVVKEDPDANLQKPPAMYPFLKKSDWRLFVAQRLSKKWQCKSEEAKKVRSCYNYNHRLSRKGYAGLIEELSQETGIDEDDIDRSLLWKIARQRKDGEFDPDIQSVVDRIDQLQNAVSNGEEVIDGTNDILTQALGTQEHRGHVRGMGKYVTPHQYFYLPRTVKEYMDMENKKWDKRFSNIENVVDKLARNMNNTSEAASCSKFVPSDNEDHEDEEEDNSCLLAVGTVSNIVAKGSIIQFHMSDGNSEVLMDRCIQEDVLLPIPREDDFIVNVKDGLGHILSWPTNLVIRCSDLAKVIKSPTKKGRRGYEDENQSKRHEKPEKVNPKKPEIEKENEKEKEPEQETEKEIEKEKEPELIEDVIEKEEIADVIEKVKENEKAVEKVIQKAKGKLIEEVKGRAKPKMKGTPGAVRRRTRAQINTRIRVESNRMLKVAAKMYDSKDISKEAASKVPCEDGIYGHESFTYISWEDFQLVFTIDELTGSVIMCYQMFLYENVKNGPDKDHGVCFVSPNATSEEKTHDVKSRNIAERLTTKGKNNIVLIPYNPGRHWVLAVLDMDTSTCYYLDSDRLEDILFCTVNPDLKRVVETALVIYSTQLGLKKRVKVNWVNVQCPRQPGKTECGYYVCKFMKEVVEGGLEVLKNNLVGGGKIEYTDADIDEVRDDWAFFVMNYMM